MAGRVAAACPRRPGRVGWRAAWPPWHRPAGSPHCSNTPPPPHTPPPTLCSLSAEIRPPDSVDSPEIHPTLTRRDSPPWRCRCWTPSPTWARSWTLLVGGVCVGGGGWVVIGPIVDSTIVGSGGSGAGPGRVGCVLGDRRCSSRRGGSAACSTPQRRPSAPHITSSALPPTPPTHPHPPPHLHPTSPHI